MSKRPNGSGTCYKATERKDKNGKKKKRKKPYIARVTVGWKINDEGKEVQVRKSLGYYKTKAEGWAAIHNFSYNRHEEMTMEQLYNEWSVQHFKNLKPGSIKGVKSKYDVHIRKIGHKKISELKLKDYQEFYDGLNLSSSTAKAVVNVISMMLDHAVRFEYIDRNHINLLQYKKYEKVLTRRIFTNKEIEMLWNNLTLKHIDTVLIMIYTGMRVGELLNLKWEDVNIKEKYLFVRESKTEAGRDRFVPLIDKIVNLLKKRKSDSEFVFSTRYGTAVKYSNYREIFVKLMDKLCMTHTIHDCRHTFASLMSNVDANQIAISKIIGHSDYRTTAKIYTQKNKDELVKAINKLNDIK